MKAYISIPITGHDEAKQRHTATRVEEMLRDMGYDTVNPFNLSDRLKMMLGRTPTYNEYLEYDLLALEQCDMIFMCHGWAESYGCRIERQKAKYAGLEIVYQH